MRSTTDPITRCFKTLGRLVCELLAKARAEGRGPAPRAPAFGWISRPMGARIDLADGDALRGALDERR